MSPNLPSTNRTYVCQDCRLTFVQGNHGRLKHRCPGCLRIHRAAVWKAYHATQIVKQHAEAAAHPPPPDQPERRPRGRPKGNQWNNFSSGAKTVIRILMLAKLHGVFDDFPFPSGFAITHPKRGVKAQ